MATINSEIRTWQEATSMLPALVFDLGQSPKVIKELFDEGCYLRYLPKGNFWAWYEKDEIVIDKEQSNHYPYKGREQVADPTYSHNGNVAILTHTIMYNYNFQTKELSHMFDEVTTVVMGSNADFTHNCTKEECTIVEMFQKFYVGYPVKCLGKCFVNAIYNDTHGKITVKSSYGTRVASFAIYENIMYLSF